MNGPEGQKANVGQGRYLLPAPSGQPPHFAPSEQSSRLFQVVQPGGDGGAVMMAVGSESDPIMFDEEENGDVKMEEE